MRVGLLWVKLDAGVSCKWEHVSVSRGIQAEVTHHESSTLNLDKANIGGPTVRQGRPGF